MPQETFPLEIKQAGDSELAVSWQDGHKSVYSCHYLRTHCRCANCIDEWTGMPRIHPQDIPEDVLPRQIVGVGRYGIRINWIDGHNTGIYTFQYLREICPCPDCRDRKEVNS